MKKGRGQVTLEYFIIFAVVALLTVIGLGTSVGTSFRTGVRAALEDFFTAAADKISTPNEGASLDAGGGGRRRGGGDEDDDDEDPKRRPRRREPE